MRLCRAVSSGATRRETSSGVRGDETSHLDRGTMILSGLRHPMFRDESEGAMKKPQIFGLTDLLQNPAQCLRSERPMPIMMRSSVAQPWPRDMSQIGGYRPVELIPVPGTDPCQAGPRRQRTTSPLGACTPARRAMLAIGGRRIQSRSPPQSHRPDQAGSASKFGHPCGRQAWLGQPGLQRGRGLG